MTTDQMHEFTRTILAPITLGELLAELPGAFSHLVRDGIWCEVVSGIDAGSAMSARLSVPLDDSRPPGYVVLIGWDSEFAIDREGERNLGNAAELSSVAIANRTKTDAERERSRAEAADVRFDLIGMLAHEMRTPLASIKGYASAMLLDEIDLDSELTVEFLEAIDEESDRLNELITHLLDSTVIEAGALELQREPLLLPELIRRTVEAMARRTHLHRLVVSCSPDVSAVLADEQRIQQVLTNLLDNAIKYSPDGGMILVRCERLGQELVVGVSDQGIGIAPEHLNKLFERFFRTEQRRTHGVRGTGLGLPIADAIVRAHGGRIWAESVVDQGSRLTFTLPIYANGVDVDEDGDEHERDE